MERIYTEPAALHNLSKAVTCIQNYTFPYTVNLKTKAKAFSDLCPDASNKPGSVFRNLNSIFVKRKFLVVAKVMTIAVILLLSIGSSTQIFGATYTSVASGNWNADATWSGSGTPVAGDVVTIANGHTITVTSNAACASVTFTGAAATLTVNPTFTLTVSGNVTLNNAAGASNACTISGSGSLSCASVVVGGTTTNLSNDRTTILTSTVSVLSISGNLSINGEDDNNDDNNATFALQSGSVTVDGSVILDDENNDCDATLTLATGAQTGTLSILGATPFIITTSPTFTANGTSATVIYTGASQTIYATTYRNLTISGSGTKTLGGTTTTSGLLTVATGTTLDMANTNLTVGSLTGSGDITNTTGTAGNRTFTIGSDNSSPPAFTGTINNGTATQVTVTKTGTGTLTLAGTGDNVGLAVTGSAGTVVLAKTSDGGVHAVGGGGLRTNGGTVQLGGTGGDQLYDGSNITLNGGTLSTGAATGLSEAITGTLTLSATSTIALATGVHTLTIANSSGVTWGGTTLNITGWTGFPGATGTASQGKIMVGVGGLSAAQLAKVAFAGYGTGSEITLSGELVPKPAAIYYSNGNVAPNTLGNWKTARDGSGTSPSNFTTAGAVYVVQNGDAMTTSATWTVSGTNSRVIIENGGSVTASHTVTMSTATTFQINDGGTFIQNVALAMSSTILGGTEIFAPNSNYEIRIMPTVTTAPSAPGYGNLTINQTTGSTALGWGGNITAVQGNFLIQGTGTGTTSHALCASVGNITVNVGGNFTMTGGNLWFSSGTSTCTMNVTGNVSVSGSSTVLNLANSSGVGTLNVSGDFSHTTGSITEGGTTTTSTIVFNGNAEQTYTFGTSGGTVANTVNYTVNEGATLNMGSSVLGKGSSGTFTIANGGTLITANELGITSSGGDGSIHVSGTRTYNTGANYIYNGTSAQATGNGLSGANTLRIDNSNGVSLTGSVAVTTLDLKQGSLSIGSYTLTLNGTVSGNGTLTGDANSVLVIGGTSGGNLGVLNFTDGSETLLTFTLNRTGSGAAVTLGSNLTVKGDMDIISGILTLVSGKWLTVDGTLANSTSANFIIESGSSVKQSSANVQATVKREILAADWGIKKDGWHLLSSPVATQAISGGFTPSGANGDYDFYSWYEPENLWINFKNTTIDPTWGQVNGNNNFTVGKGYLVAYENSSTKEFSGSLNYQNVTISLTNNNSSANYSWNLLGNPFPASLIWHTGWTTTSDIAANCQVWDEGLQNYSPILPGGIIPALNGFMVEVNESVTTTSVTIPANKQDHSSDAWYKKTENNNQLLKLSLKASDGNSGQVIYIQENPSSTELFDSEYDGHYLRGYGPVFYSIAGNDTLSVNTLPAFNESLIIPLVFQKNEGDEYVLTVSGVENFEVPIYLTDKKTGVIQNLGYNPVYSFSSAEGDNINRFTLSFKSPTSIKEETEEKFTVSVVNGVITLQSDQSLTGTVKVSDMLGRTVAMENMVADSPLQIHLNSTPGVYVVSVYTRSKTYSQKVVIR